MKLVELEETDLTVPDLARLARKEPVILTRFAIALCVFSFCFITLLSVFLFLRGKV